MAEAGLIQGGRQKIVPRTKMAPGKQKRNRKLKLTIGTIRRERDN
jgi:hypothetical protein